MIARPGARAPPSAGGGAGPAAPAGPAGPCGPGRSCPLLKSRARSEKSFTCTVVTLFRGSRVMAYPVPARPNASARQATTMAGDGTRRRIRRMTNLPGGCLDVWEEFPPGEIQEPLLVGADLVHVGVREAGLRVRVDLLQHRPGVGAVRNRLGDVLLRDALGGGGEVLRQRELLVQRPVETR